MDKLAQRLAGRVEQLAGTIGPRHYRRPGSLEATRDFIEGHLRESGLRPRRHSFTVAGMDFDNIEILVEGHEPHAPCLVVGAHYDTVDSTPGADDNASAVAGLLEFAEQLHSMQLARSVRLVFFPNEEPPFYPDSGMGSAAYAQLLQQQGIAVDLMISLEMLGYFSDADNSQKYPPGLGFFYPDRGNFIAFVGNLRSRHAIARVKAAFQRVSSFPCESLAAPEWTIVVGLSDHRSFWSAGYPGLMVTDTAFLRNPHYHRPSDTPDTLDYERFAQVTQGMIDAVVLLASDAPSTTPAK